MSNKTLTITCLITLVFAISGCVKLEEQSFDRTLQSEEVTMSDAIPLEYGKLVGIVESGPYISVLYFEKPDRTITAVSVNHSRGVMGSSVLVIPRR